MTHLGRGLLSVLLVVAVGSATADAATTPKPKTDDVSLKLAQSNNARILRYFVRQHPEATYEIPKPCKRLSRRAVNCSILEHRIVADVKEKVLYTTHTKSSVEGRKVTFTTVTTAGAPQPDA